jgi:hypothetical protein
VGGSHFVTPVSTAYLNSVASGKYRNFLMKLRHAYRDLMMILSIIKKKVSKPSHTWVKPSHSRNLAYWRLKFNLFQEVFTGKFQHTDQERGGV